MLRTLALICLATPPLAGEPVETREILVRCSGGGTLIRVNPVTRVAYVGGARHVATTLTDRLIVIKGIETYSIDRVTGNLSIARWNGEVRSILSCSEAGLHEEADQTPRG
jgi:hypothetical protein